MTFDLSLVPFSLRGSYLGLNRLPDKRARELGKAPGLFLRTYHGGVPMSDREIFRVETLVRGRAVHPRENATPGRLRLTASKGFVDFAFSDVRTLRIRGESGAVLRLSASTGAYDYARPAGEDRWELNFFSQRIMLQLSRLSGSVRVDAPWQEQKADSVTITCEPAQAGGTWEVALEEFSTAWVPRAYAEPFETLVTNAEHSFSRWLARTPTAPRPMSRARELAAYVQWCSLVAPAGHLGREAMYMSKNWMVNVWSWDHCFNAIALASGQPDVAWDQWALLFDFQNEHGALPDCVNDREIVWNFAKPPVHGWALREMLARSPALQKDRSKLRQAYRWLSAWTGWWLGFRDDDNDGLPQYNHGNDSGWDNATVFGAGMPVEGPDLAAFLIVQMEVLADLAERLGQNAAARRWRHKANELTAALLAHSWQGDHFVAPRSGDHVLADGDSLVPYMPLLLGDRLPADVRTALVRGVRRFVTAHGIATEHPHSPLYLPDGYWRGPIWAPSTCLIVSGLRACGESTLAATIAQRFCRTVAKSGNAENFDALTGAGLRDCAYTWTASVFLLLAALPARRPTR